MADGVADGVELVLPAGESSVEKLEGWLDQLAQARSNDAGQAMVLNTGRQLIPALRKLGYIPTDPAELDTVLLALAKWALVTRSDDAWQPESLDALFLGPPAQESSP